MLSKTLPFTVFLHVYCIQIIQYVQYIHALQTHPGVLIRLFVGLFLYFSFTVWMVVPRRLDSGSKKTLSISRTS